MSSSSKGEKASGEEEEESSGDTLLNTTIHVRRLVPELAVPYVLQRELRLNAEVCST